MCVSLNIKTDGALSELRVFQTRLTFSVPLEGKAAGFTFLLVFLTVARWLIKTTEQLEHACSDGADCSASGITDCSCGGRLFQSTSNSTMAEKLGLWKATFHVIMNMYNGGLINTHEFINKRSFFIFLPCVTCLKMLPSLKKGVTLLTA